MRINAALPAFELRMITQLNRLSKAIDQNNLRLSTLKRINAAADDPSGLFFVESQRASLATVQSLLGNIEQARSVVDSADSTVSQVSTLLGTIRSAALEAAGGTLSQAEIQANQDVIDAAVNAINSLSGSEFGGRRLLDGSRDYNVSGVNTSEVDAVAVYDRSSTSASQTLEIEVTVEAEQAQINYAGKPGALAQATAEFTITGATGSASFSVVADEPLTAVRDRINAESYATGVSAAVSGDNLVFTSTDFGSEATIAVEVTSGTFAVTGGNGDGTAEGIDAVATVNGTTVTGDGLTLRYRSGALDADITLDATVAAGTLDTITVSGQALAFQISDLPASPASLSLPSIHSASLGGLSGRLSEVASGGGTSLLDGDYSTLIQIVDEAEDQILSTQARLGAFSSYTLDSAEAVFEDLEVNLTESIAQVEDADIALETALLARNTLLADNAAAALLIAGNRNQSILQIIQQLAFG